MVWSEHDRLTHRERFRVATLYRVTPGQETTLPGCGHLMIHDQPDDVTRLILDHLPAPSIPEPTLRSA